MSPGKPQILFTRSDIEERIGQLGAEIGREYRDKNPLVIGVLKGSFVFMSDLVRRLDFPLEIEFVRLSSYGSGQETCGKVKMLSPLCTPVKDRHVLVVEDIVDTGITLNCLFDILRKEKPASLRLCALLDKPSRRRVPLTIDYLGMTVPDKFLVGYGLDYDEKYRNLPDVCCLED